jgi:hypothetical protein
VVQRCNGATRVVRWHRAGFRLYWSLISNPYRLYFRRFHFGFPAIRHRSRRYPTAREKPNSFRAATSNHQPSSSSSGARGTRPKRLGRNATFFPTAWERELHEVKVRLFHYRALRHFSPFRGHLRTLRDTLRELRKWLLRKGLWSPRVRLRTFVAAPALAPVRHPSCTYFQVLGSPR